MKVKIKEYKDGIEAAAKINNRRVIVFQKNDDRSFYFKFVRLDDTTESVALEEKPHKRISSLTIHLSEEGTKAITICIAEIVKYKMTLK